ncbi:MAG: hypothetical protein IPL63_17615 [Saprospiraceae bacterium]|jgi:thiol:disulfide interchange protein DsbD|nr:hypothetical protein [Saprospiraceae bacterium]MBK6566378.1 hypothetical protein [Saprospiraceae bacterium]MBK6783385.1 hypothetical protein [Saprospiraceae bacterium]MBK7524302.1 hypothetical protein [Saprospiraceae bacterium]MBK8372778.1 hypothetical protein [Saprospiraceae bacterium]
MNTLNFGFIFFLLFSFSLYGQSPVNWNFEFRDKGDKIEVIATASMQKNWNIYSQHTEDNGPIPTGFYIGEELVVFQENSKAIKHLDPLFEVNVIKFKENASFSYIYQKGAKKEIKGYVTFMACNDEKCLPPSDVPFNFTW